MDTGRCPLLCQASRAVLSFYLFFFPFVFTGESSGGTRAPRWDHLSCLLPSRLLQVAAAGWAAAWQNSFQEKPPEPASWAAAPRRLGAAMEKAHGRGDASRSASHEGTAGGGECRVSRI